MRQSGFQRSGALRALGIVVATMMVSDGLMAQSLTWLDTRPGDPFGVSSAAYGVSADGRVVVGKGTNPLLQIFAVRWVRQDPNQWVMQNLPTLGGGGDLLGTAYGVSADGSVAVGWAAYPGGSWHAVRWIEVAGPVPQDLGTLGGTYSEAYGVSADGNVVVGVSEDANSQRRAFWWQGGQMHPLGTLGGSESVAYGVSVVEGTKWVVGSAQTGGGVWHACLWRAGVVMPPPRDLGTLPGGTDSEAYDVSEQLTAIVGWSHNANNQRRAVWWVRTQAGWIIGDLGTLGGSESIAYGVAEGGRVVVGTAQNANGQWRAVRWIRGRIEDLNTTYACLLTDGSVLREARAISSDGRYIVGGGYNATRQRYEAFLLDTLCTAHNGDVNGDGCVDDADLLAVLFAFGQSGSCLGRVDVNCDGTVDDADLLIVLFNFGSGC